MTDATDALAARMSRSNVADPEGAAGEDPEDFGLRIAADGRWFHEGREIARKPLVKLFASVLRRDEDGRYWLVTPVERGRIVVDDAPFVVVEARASGEGPARSVMVRTNLDEEVTLGEDHPLSMRAGPSGDGPVPYVTIRPGLEAKALRAVYYHLVDMADARPAPGAPGKVELGLWSGGVFHGLGLVEDEDA